MALPKYSDMVNPILRILSDGKAKNKNDILKYLKDEFKPTEEELNLRIQNGTPKFSHRVGWAVFDLTKAKLVERVDRAIYKISERGLDFFTKHPEFTFEDLMDIPEFYEFRRNMATKSKGKVKKKESITSTEDTPEENLEEMFDILIERTKSAVLEKLRTCSPSKFEEICLKLLVALGYGGSQEEAYELLGKSHDEGVDGVIKQDKLGLESVYIQAKRWNNNPVGREKVQQFSGAIEGKATKGVMMTTSHFTKEALEYAMRPGTKTIILIDGEKMARLLMDKGLGVETIKDYRITKLDESFFEED